MDQFLSTEKMIFSLGMPYMKWVASKVQHQFNLTTLSPTKSSLTPLYNSDKKLWTCAFICFVIDVDKNNFMFIGKKENKIFLIIHLTSSHKKSHFSLTYLCTQYHPKTKKLYLNYQKLPTTLQGCVQTHFPPTVEQPLN